VPENEELGRERHLVVVFDICSSTTILEDLKRTDNLAAWSSLLLEMKDFLQGEGSRLAMCLYKFIGDGWVLLFPDGVPKKDLCGLLCRCSEWYQNQFDRSIKPLLLQEPTPIGLMFGIDSGELIRLELDDQIEYLGRAINVSARLQAQTKDLRGGPSYKALFSRNSFNSPGPPPKDIPVEAARVSLRNISPATIECFVFQTMTDRQATSQTPRVETAASPGKKTQAGAAAPAPPAAVSPKTATGMPPAAAKVAAPPATGAKTGVQAAVKAASFNIQAVDLRPNWISPLGALSKWTYHAEGQEAAVIQFKNEAPADGKASRGVVAKALLIYVVDGQEVLRIHGSWVDGHDQARLNAADLRGLILGVRGENGFFALDAVRMTLKGTERVEIRPAPIAGNPARLSVIVQLTDAAKQGLLFEGEFAIATKPLMVARVQ